jgi:hypothetical protein
MNLRLTADANISFRKLELRRWRLWPAAATTSKVAVSRK